MKRATLLLFLLAAWMPAAFAHEVRPAYLELKQTGAETYDVLWKVPRQGDDLRLAIDVELPADCRNVIPPQRSTVDGAFTDRWRFTRAGGITGCTIGIKGLASTMTDVLVRFERSDGTTQVTRLTPHQSSFVVEAGPRPLEVVRTYLMLGVEHILLGVDHLLFVLALLVLVRGWRRLVATITAFTVAHSITLAAATLGLVSVPGPPVEAVIALSIVFVASEIVHRRQGRTGLTERRPWIVAFTFGLLHGLGFAGALHEVGLPQNSIPLALLFFNVGVELGQLVFIAAVTAVIAIAARVATRVRRSSAARDSAFPGVESVTAYGIGTVAMFWLIDRTVAFFA